MPDQRYLVTARKYRPQLFGELVAQEHVSETLQNAIRLDRLAHAYLFSGPRGVGKTTAARILAKAINCTTPLAERPSAEPCRHCESCRSFEEGRSLNIIEIDAASNNKVEDIRELRETVRIPPQGSRKKVYIVDEVHMLSNAAFNALLKTLEEPPPYVLFIFATTEPNKVLPTILSRCQRFDFRRIAAPDIVGRLEEICREEGITADEGALMLLARKADGALRDALSAFDQAVSLCGTDLRYAELRQALGVVDVDLFFEVTAHVAEGSSAGMLRLVERIMRAGYDLQEFLGGLAEHFRNQLVACTMPDTTLIEATQATQQRYAEAAGHFSEADLLRLLTLAAEAEEQIKSSTQPRLRLETALLKMASLSHTADLRQALRKIDALEALAREGKLPTPSEAAAAPPRPEPAAPLQEAAAPEQEPLPEAPRRPAIHPMRPSRPSSDTSERAEPEHKRAEPEKRGLQPVPQQAAARRPTETESEEEAEILDKEPEAEMPAEEPEAEEPAAAPVGGYPSLFGPPALSRKKVPSGSTGTEGEAPEPQAMFAGSGALSAAPAGETAPTPLLQKISQLWPRYVRSVKEERIHVGSLLQQGLPAQAQDGTLVVAVPDAFHQRLLGSQDAFLREHLQEAFEVGVERLAFAVREEAQDVPTQETTPDVDPHAYMQQKRQESPVISAIFEHFGGELVW